jgi:predicted nucleic acid-binding protein
MNFPNLEVADLDRDVIRLAARTRADYRLRPPDALQVRACIRCGAQVFITNDRRINRMKDKLDIVVLDDFLG